LDFFSQLKIKDDVMDETKAQALYGYYFEKSADVLKRSDVVETEIWKKSIESIFLIVEKMKEKINKKAPTDPNAPEAPIEEDSRLKLFQKFQAV
jgi:hypothetical protein